MLIGTITGRLTAEPELRYTNTGTPIATMTIAADNRRDDDGTTFLKTTAFGKLAETAAEHLTKGQQVTASGRLEGRQWITDDRQNQTTFELTADHIEFGTKPRPTTN